MNSQSFLIVQNFIASITLKGLLHSFVGPGMRDQVRLVVETLETNLALIRFISRMQPRVDQQFVLGFENLSAGHAGKVVIHSVLAVHFFVAGQRVLAAELFVAHSAFERQLFTVGSEVFFQLCLRIEAFGTHFAAVTNLRRYHDW